MQNQLKTWISKIKNFERFSLASVLLGILVIVGAWYAANKIITKEVTETFYNDVKNTEVRTYSLNGEITKLDLPQIEMEVGQVVTTAEGNVLTYRTHKITITNSTEFTKKGADQTYSSSDSAQLMLNGNITIYTEQNPYTNEQVIAQKIEIN